MIYFVTGRPALFTEEFGVEFCSVEKAIEMLEPLTKIGLDTETQGLDPHTKSLLSVQMGCKEFQVVIDCGTIDINLFKGILEDKKRLFILQNAKFDLQFFYHKRIVLNNIYDTFLAEKLLYLGYPPGMVSMSLKTLGRKYCSVDLDKSVRGEIIKKGFTQRVIQYGADDVKYLEEIMNKQKIKLAEKDLLSAASFEFSFVESLAYIEYCGVKLDVDRWKKKIHNDLLRLNKAEEALNNWVLQHFSKNHKFCTFPEMNNLFEPIDMNKPICTLNWQSPKQLIPLFEELGYNLLVKDKITGGMKKSIEIKVLTLQPDVSDILPLYLEYSTAAKIVSTYGESFLTQINDKTKRIHTNFTQLMDTGRLSSGGKDKYAKIQYVNLQNIPSDAETRACFIAEKGYKWLSADYKGQESVILANVSQDKAILELLRNNGDLHSLVAKMVFPEELKDIPLEEVKAKRKDLRDKAKGPEFLFGYGGDANALHHTKGIPLEEAKRIEANYKKGFKGVAAYQRWARAQVMKDGFILLNPLTKHKSYIFDYERLKEISSRFNQEFWAEYRKDKDANILSPIVEDVRYYFKRKSDIEKQSINYRIQGTGACTFKLASILLFEALKKKDWLFKVKYTIPVHDEINLEAPEEIAEECGKLLVQCMKDSGAYFCRIFPLDADINIGDFWIH